MDKNVLFNISYGMYILATKDEENRNVGCVVNTVIQTSADPISIAVSSNNNNYTTNAIIKNGLFTVSILSVKATIETIGLFGFSTSKDKDKFKNMDFELTQSKLPILKTQTCSYLECKVKETIDCYTHKIIIADLIDAINFNKEQPMTYDYYHKVVKGKVPKNAATYNYLN